MINFKWVFIFIILIFAVPKAFAIKEYYSISRSVRALGMGNAFYGLSNDEYAFFYNPAGLSTYSRKGQWMFHINSQISNNGISAAKQIMDTFDDTSDIGNIVDSLASFQGDPLYANFNIFNYYIQKNFGIGLLIADTKGTFSLVGREIDTELDVTAISDSGLFLTYARAPFENMKNLHFGITGKVLYRAGGRSRFTVLEIAQGGTLSVSPNDLGGAGLGIDADIGAIYELEPSQLPSWANSIQLGFTLSNLLATKFNGFKSGGNPPQLPRYVSFGMYAALPSWGPVDNFNLLVDLSEFGIGGQPDPHLGKRGGSFWKHVNLGLEASFRGWFRPRIGFHQGLFSAGFGFNFKYLKLNFAWYAEELADRINQLNKRRFALNIGFGAGSAPPPPVKKQFYQPDGSFELPKSTDPREESKWLRSKKQRQELKKQKRLKKRSKKLKKRKRPLDNKSPQELESEVNQLIPTKEVVN